MIEAIVFDMDGVLVDTAKFWEQAEKEVFSDLGVKMKKELTELTKHLTTKEVTDFWFKQSPWDQISKSDVEQQVIGKVKQLIKAENCIVPNVVETIKSLKQRGMKIGLATNAPFSFISIVLNKLEVTYCFDAVASAEFVVQGKPAPDVYNSTIAELKIPAHQCIAIEDSNSGIIAAKKAGMQVVGFGESKERLIGADFYLENFNEADWNQILKA